MIGPLVGRLSSSTPPRGAGSSRINVPFVLITLCLVAVRRAGARARAADATRRLARRARCARSGSPGSCFGLIEQPRDGWGSPAVVGVRCSAGVAAASPRFVVCEARTPRPMLPLELFRRRNFAVGNLETFVDVRAGSALLFFFLVLFLQQVAGYDALEAGIATIPATLVMFALSRASGALADRYGPRLFMGGGPADRAPPASRCSCASDADVDYVTELLPGAAGVLARARR